MVGDRTASARALPGVPAPPRDAAQQPRHEGARGQPAVQGLGALRQGRQEQRVLQRHDGRRRGQLPVDSLRRRLQHGALAVPGGVALPGGGVLLLRLLHPGAADPLRRLQAEAGLRERGVVRLRLLPAVRDDAGDVDRACLPGPLHGRRRGVGGLQPALHAPHAAAPAPHPHGAAPAALPGDAHAGEGHLGGPQRGHHHHGPADHHPLRLCHHLQGGGGRLPGGRRSLLLRRRRLHEDAPHARDAAGQPRRDPESYLREGGSLHVAPLARLHLHQQLHRPQHADRNPVRGGLAGVAVGEGGGRDLLPETPLAGHLGLL
mmetsp:Transcript_115839/g.338771  ORF Transcript_115839/g.338771 Transcript_115839/m.338771 type:complete len:318 (+) Transcript_115839:711-1664(+)